MKTLHYLTLLAFISLNSANAETVVSNFEKVLKQVKAAHSELEKSVQGALAIDQNIKSIDEQIATHRQTIADLEQQAEEIAMMANQAMPMNGGGGGGGSGGGSGSGSGHGGGEAPKLPELSQAPQFELPQAPSESANLASVASAFGNDSRRGFAPGSTEFAKPFDFKMPEKDPNSGFISPATVASGKLPSLSGPTSIPDSLSKNAASANSAGSSGSGNSTGSGMMGGGGQGAGNSGAQSGGDGASLASVGVEPPEGEAARPRIETTQSGVGGDGGGSAEGSAGSEVDESSIKAQLAKGGNEAPLAGKETVIKNPEGKGLMGWVGWIGDSCKASGAKETLSICSAPRMRAEDAVFLAQHKDSTLSPEAATRVERSVASKAENAIAPMEASAGPVRDGILGLLSGR